MPAAVIAKDYFFHRHTEGTGVTPGEDDGGIAAGFIVLLKGKVEILMPYRRLQHFTRNVQRLNQHGNCLDRQFAQAVQFQMSNQVAGITVPQQ